MALPWGLNETSVEAEPRGENAILLFNHTDNLFSLSLPPTPPPHCYFSLGLVKLFTLYTHICQASNREATVNEGDGGEVWSRMESTGSFTYLKDMITF